MPSERVAILVDQFYDARTNGTAEFFELVANHLQPGDRLLDLGCGPGKKETNYQARGAVVFGCDYTNDVARNRFVVAGVRGDAYHLPFADETFDIVTMDFVAEHLESPQLCVAELARVLRPGGRVFFRTPNFYHYVALIAYLTPHWFHRLVIHALDGSNEREAFATFYRANTRRTLRRLFSACELSCEQMRVIEKEPFYLSFAVPSFWIGYLYERVVNRFAVLEMFRSSILGHFRKSTGPTS